MNPIFVTSRPRRAPPAHAGALPCALLALSLLASPTRAQPLIALIDSGVDGTHPALAGRMVAGYDFVDGDSIPDDLLGHGTGMAGIIAARGVVQGVCPTCLIMPLKVAGPADGGRVSARRLAQAIEYAVEHGARLIFVGAGFAGLDPAVANAVANAEANGIPVVAPAGSGELLQTLYPAAIRTVISVAAAEDGPRPHDTVVAPGENVRTAALGGGTAVCSGSSVAAARVAGAAGRALQTGPGLSTAQIRQVLRFGTAPRGAPFRTDDLEPRMHDLTKVLARASTRYVDVAITRMTLFPNTPLTDQSPLLRVCVTNQGNVVTSGTTLSVTWNGSRADSAAVPALALGQTVELEITLPKSSAAADIRVNASLPSQPGETEIADNTASLVAEYRPVAWHDVDLEVGAPSEPVGEAGTLTLPVEVRNRGNQAEPHVTVEVAVDDVPVAARVFDLPVGAEDTMSGSWTTSPRGPSAVHTVTVRATPLGGDDHPEDNEWGADLAVGGRSDSGRLQYADRAGTDIVMDAPWRTVRDYIPVLFFFPEFEGSRRVERIRVFNYVGGVPAGPPVVVDARIGADTLNGATFIGPLGEARGGLTDQDRVRHFWHYVMRIPHEALAAHGTLDVHYLYAEVEWSRQVFFWRQRLRNHRVLRVLVEPAQFPSFDPCDRYFDTHVHTIAEQTTSGVLDVNGAHKAFGGPIVMLLESSYALGLVQTQPRDGNWTAYADSVVVTDHNMFYSTGPYDTGALPGFGPTSTEANGHAAEAAWYRRNLGRLAGEEITLRRGSNQDNSVQPNIGHHLLAYDTRHFEGPWHGGLFLTSRLENPNTLETVLTGMKATGTTGFVYAAHPNLASFVWPPEYFAQAIGVPPYNSNAGPLVNSSATDFLFKGSEVWNIKADEVARGSGHLPASSAFDAMNPFIGGAAAQRFAPHPWDGELIQSLDTMFGQLGRGLRFAFQETPKERFIRKLYMSAGSDAHGDFNYTDEVSATAVPYSGALTSNAFARVRTYALVHDRPLDARDALDALRDGNTVLSDGPIVKYHLDADARHDPEAGTARWHDAVTRWENADGKIGGLGKFDGGRTMLVPLPGADVWVRSLWKRSATPDAGDLTKYKFDRVMESTRDSFDVSAGLDGIPDERPLPRAMDRLAALVVTARDLRRDERCITNPVWVVPVRIEIAAPAAQQHAALPFAIPPRTLKVVFHFPLSMAAGAATRACLRPLDSCGNSTDPEIELVPDPGWGEEDGVTAARYSATNADSVAFPPGDWDADSHTCVPGMKSFVVYLESPTDVHGNVLNDIGRAFAFPTATPIEAPEQH